MYTMYVKNRKYALLIPFSKNVELPLSILASKCWPPPLARSAGGANPP